jgi:hypothetical protein
LKHEFDKALIYLGAFWIFLILTVHWVLSLLFWHGYIWISVNWYHEGIFEIIGLAFYAALMLNMAIDAVRGKREQKQ